MNGPSAELCVKTTRAPGSTSASTIGVSHQYLLRQKNARSSFTVATLVLKLFLLLLMSFFPSTSIGTYQAVALLRMRCGSYGIPICSPQAILRPIMIKNPPSLPPPRSMPSCAIKWSSADPLGCGSKSASSGVNEPPAVHLGMLLMNSTPEESNHRSISPKECLDSWGCLY